MRIALINIALLMGFWVLTTHPAYPQALPHPVHKSFVGSNPSAVAPGYSSHEDKYDVSFYFLNLEAGNKSTFIKGYSLLHASRLSPTIDTFVVELSRMLAVDSVFLNDKREDVFYRENDLLKIPLREGGKSEREYRLKVFYQGAAGSSGFYSGISNARASNYNQDITYTLSEPFQAKDWFPVKQNLTDKADSVWIFITVDSILKAGSNGLLTDVVLLEDGRKRYEWKSAYPIAYYLLSFSVGDYIDYSFYASINGTDSILVQNYIYNTAGILESLKEEIDHTGPLLKVFTEKFGPYPFAKEKYGHCMAPMGGGMEHQTMTTISGFNFGLIGHELAHQWFGDYLTCGTWQDIWINEGFASYAEYIAIEELKTRQEAVEWLAQAHSLAINFPLGSVFLSLEESRSVQRIFNYSLSYKKGAAIIHMLRYEIDNDSLFFAIVKDYVIKFANKTATAEDFRQVVEDHSKEDYDWFFRQWYYGKGHPVFVASWRQVGDSLYISSTQTSSTGKSDFFRTHMDYRIRYESGETYDIRVFHGKPGEIFRIHVSDVVGSVQTDPDSNVLKNAMIYEYVDLSKVFSASPNPFANELNIKFRSSNKYREIKLSGINGQVFLNESTTSGSYRANLSQLSAGIYLLNVTEDGIKYTEKLVKL